MQVTGNGHLYQCTTAGTTGSTQPAWPVSGGTVTDGTAVWTDLGTPATAIPYLSQAATANNTGVTLSYVNPNRNPRLDDVVRQPPRPGLRRDVSDMAGQDPPPGPGPRSA